MSWIKTAASPLKISSTLHQNSCCFAGEARWLILNTAESYSDFLLFSWYIQNNGRKAQYWVKVLGGICFSTGGIPPNVRLPPILSPWSKLMIFWSATGSHMLRTSSDDRVQGWEVGTANRTHTHSEGRVTGHSCPVNHLAGPLAPRKPTASVEFFFF